MTFIDGVLKMIFNKAIVVDNAFIFHSLSLLFVLFKLF